MLSMSQMLTIHVLRCARVSGFKLLFICLFLPQGLKMALHKCAGYVMNDMNSEMGTTITQQM